MRQQLQLSIAYCIRSPGRRRSELRRRSRHLDLDMGTTIVRGAAPASGMPLPMCAFVDEVLAELEAMAKDGTQPMRSGPKRAAIDRSGAPQGRHGDLVRLFSVACSGVQSDCCATFAFNTLYGLFARWFRARSLAPVAGPAAPVIGGLPGNTQPSLWTSARFLPHSTKGPSFLSRSTDGRRKNPGRQDQCHH